MKRDFATYYPLDYPASQSRRIMTYKAFLPLLLLVTMRLPAEDWQKKLAENNGNRIALNLVDTKASKLADYIRALSGHSSFATAFDPPSLSDIIVEQYRYDGPSAHEAFTILAKASGLQISYTDTGLTFSLGSQNWKASDGRVIEANFVKQDGEAVVIERGGQQFQVPFDKLSPESVLLAKKLARATGTAPPRATPANSLLPERLEIKSLQLLGDGTVLLSGDNVTEDKHGIMYHGSSAGKEWKKLEFHGNFWGDCITAPSDLRAITATIGVDRVSQICFSKDGGANWQVASPSGIEAEGKKLDVFRPFWPAQGIDRLILATSLPGFYEWDLASKKARLLSSVSERITDYRFSEGAHFIRLGFSEPMKCLKSTDDAKSWTPVTPDATPWKHAAKASSLLDSFAENKIGNHGVMWTAQIEGVSFCHLAPRSNQSASSKTASVFFSTNQGTSWQPVPLDSRTTDIATLFAGSPLVRESSDGVKLISPGRRLSVHYDSTNKCVYASDGAEWFVSHLPSGPWQRINELPEP